MKRIVTIILTIVMMITVVPMVSANDYDVNDIGDFAELTAEVSEYSIKTAYFGSNGKINTSIDYTGTEECPAKLIVANFNANNKISSVQAIDINGDTTLCIDHTRTDEETVKLFVWESFDTIMPLSKSATVSDPSTVKAVDLSNSENLSADLSTSEINVSPGETFDLIVKLTEATDKTKAVNVGQAISTIEYDTESFEMSYDVKKSSTCYEDAETEEDVYFALKTRDFNADNGDGKAVLGGLGSPYTIIPEYEFARIKVTVAEDAAVGSYDFSCIQIAVMTPQSAAIVNNEIVTTTVNVVLDPVGVVARDITVSDNIEADLSTSEINVLPGDTFDLIVKLSDANEKPRALNVGQAISTIAYDTENFEMSYTAKKSDISYEDPETEEDIYYALKAREFVADNGNGHAILGGIAAPYKIVPGYEFARIKVTVAEDAALGSYDFSCIQIAAMTPQNAVIVNDEVVTTTVNVILDPVKSVAKDISSDDCIAADLSASKIDVSPGETFDLILKLSGETDSTHALNVGQAVSTIAYDTESFGMSYSAKKSTVSYEDPETEEDIYYALKTRDFVADNGNGQAILGGLAAPYKIVPGYEFARIKVTVAEDAAEGSYDFSCVQIAGLTPEGQAVVNEDVVTVTVNVVR